MNWNDIPWNPSSRQLRQFGILAAIILLSYSLAGTYGWGSRRHPQLLGAATCGLAVIAVLRPTWLRWPFVGLIVVSFPIGWVMAKLILLGVFFGMLAPLAAVLRWAKRDALQLQSPPADLCTFWEAKQPHADRNRYFRQF